ncbi:flocculation protein FLO11 isoform X1 [Cheilinus undulatus]|uniref:flocculation protein FLO11 isoform X1 n=1 Tax=Cheilinus undulatus TaxID=241271 RepID=UPI001BD4A64A|nr:flocculation protein FLO11 isoform X1 [Cheilinus undulatus]XP_041659451.1 flocculation protein FLO11 isoform X1 [Cheilinus undulatus]
MSAQWREEDDLRQGGGRGVPLKSKPRFSFHEVRVLLDAVKRNRYILLRKFNRGVSVDTKKQTWIEITNQINDLGENHREVRQIMKKWADLKCDGKRRLLALRNPHLRKKNMGPVEKMVHKILMMSPRGNGDSDFDLCEDEDLPKTFSNTPPPNHSSYSYLSITDTSQPVPDRFSYDMSPLSSPEDDAGGDQFQSSPEFDFDLAEDGADQAVDFDDNEDSMLSSYPSSLPPPSSSSLDQDPLSDTQLRIKPVHTYSRNSTQNNNNNHVQNHTSSKATPGHSSPSSVASTSSAPPLVSDSVGASSSAAPPPPLPQPPTSSSMTSSSSFVSPLPPPPSSTFVTPNGSTYQSTPSSSSTAVSSSSSASTTTPTPSYSNSQQPSKQALTPSSCDPLPAGASTRRAQDHVAQMASQSLQQQRASRMLLASVSQSLEVLAQSVQLLVESQQEFVQESLLLQRETVEVLRDFSNTALTMLRDKTNSGQMPRHHLHHPASQDKHWF